MAASAPPACSTSRKEVSAFMRRAGIILAMLIALTSLNTGTGGAAGSTSAPQFVPDQLLINLKSGTDLSLILQMVGGGLSQYLDGLGTYVVRVPPGTVESAIAILRTYPQVRFVEPNYYVRYFLDPDDPYDNSTCYPTSDGQCTMQWAWAKVGAYQAWDLTTGSEAVKVAVVDTGIDIGNPDYIIPDPTGHEDLVTCRSIVTQNFVTTESNNDENGHGTHVAGTIGALLGTRRRHSLGGRCRCEGHQPQRGRVAAQQDARAGDQLRLEQGRGAGVRRGQHWDHHKVVPRRLRGLYRRSRDRRDRCAGLVLQLRSGLGRCGGARSPDPLDDAGQLQHVFSVLLVRDLSWLRCDERDVHGRAARVRSGGLDLGAGQVHIKYLRAGGD